MGKKMQELSDYYSTLQLFSLRWMGEAKVAINNEESGGVGLADPTFEMPPSSQSPSACLGLPEGKSLD